jgi:hypothetical protein
MNTKYSFELFSLPSVYNDVIQQPEIAEYDCRLTEKCSIEIKKWMPGIPMTKCAELSHLKKFKLLADGSQQDESG